MCLGRRRGLHRDPVRAPISSNNVKGGSPSTVMRQQSPILQSKSTEPMSESLLGQVRTVPILSSLKDEELRCLDGVRETRTKKDDILARQGEVAHYFWILLEGEIRIYQTLADGHEVALPSIPSGNAFGELPLLCNMPNMASLQATAPCHLVQFDEDQFWNLMTSCPDVRRAILGNMANRFQKLQRVTVQHYKMPSLGTLPAGLMHELNNPGAAARRAASQLRENLLRMHELTARFTRIPLTDAQRQCMFDLQEHALAVKQPIMMNSLEQSDAEEKLAEWIEAANIENPRKTAPTLVSVGLDERELECARRQFPGPSFSAALSWLDALVSSMQLVNTVEESIGRVSDLVHAVKSNASEAT